MRQSNVYVTGDERVVGRHDTPAAGEDALTRRVRTSSLVDSNYLGKSRNGPSGTTFEHRRVVETPKLLH
jgi:hypothetical protein